jgi:hypothetical protein
VNASLTLCFPFSASYSREGHVVGCNYKLYLTVDSVPQSQERVLKDAVHQRLISLIHTTDFDTVGHLLYQEGREDSQLLGAFWDALKKPLETFRVRSMALRRDADTITTLVLSGS